MPPAVARPNRTRNRLALGLLATAVVAAATWSVPGTPASADTAAPHTITVTPKDGLVDGQLIQVTVHTEPGRKMGKGLVYVCRADATYDSVADLDPAAGKCPLEGISSSGSGVVPIIPHPDQLTSSVSLRVGVGTVQWTRGGTHSLTCDPTHPCRLVVSIPGGGGQGALIIDSSTMLTFAGDSVAGACTGTNPDAPTSGGPDRMLGSWVAWTRHKCTISGGLAATGSVFTGEGDGHEDFATELVDLTYSAVGPAFHEADATRASVSVPIAANAAVIGLLGGYYTPQADWPTLVPKPFSDVKITQADIAVALGQGVFPFDLGDFVNPSPFDELKIRSPQMAGLQTSMVRPVQAPASADAVSWFTTGALDRNAAAAWKTAPQNIDDNPPNVPRSQVESLADASPKFAVSIAELYSTQAALKKTAAVPFLESQFGAIWVLTDLATARQLGIPTASIQNTRGEFVTPDEESIGKALATFTQAADGTWLPPTEDAAGAYPLTFVEHAVAPAQPLREEDCTKRTATQALLADWLTYITGAGQADLPDGLVPLTPALATAAGAATSKVGASPTTGTCAEVPPVVPPVEPPPSVDPPAEPGGELGPSDVPDDLSDLDLDLDLDSGLGDTSGLGSNGLDDVGIGDDGIDTIGGPDDATNPAGPLTEGGAGAPTAESTGAPQLIAEVQYPGIAGSSPLGGARGAFALVVLALLGAAGGLVSTGRGIPRPARRRS